MMPHPQAMTDNLSMHTFQSIYVESCSTCASAHKASACALCWAVCHLQSTKSIFGMRTRTPLRWLTAVKTLYKQWSLSNICEFVHLCKINRYSWNLPSKCFTTLAVQAHTPNGFSFGYVKNKTKQKSSWISVASINLPPGIKAGRLFKNWLLLFLLKPEMNFCMLYYHVNTRF